MVTRIGRRIAVERPLQSFRCHSTPLTLLGDEMKEVSMRFGVSIILLVAKHKERSDSNPKGIGDVASRPQRRLFSPEFMRFADCPAMVAARDRLGAHPTSEGLYLD